MQSPRRKKSPDLNSWASQSDVGFLNQDIQIFSSKSGENIFFSTAHSGKYTHWIRVHLVKFCALRHEYIVWFKSQLSIEQPRRQISLLPVMQGYKEEGFSVLGSRTNHITCWRRGFLLVSSYLGRGSNAQHICLILAPPPCETLVWLWLHVQTLQ